MYGSFKTLERFLSDSWTIFVRSGTILLDSHQIGEILWRFSWDALQDLDKIFLLSCFLTQLFPIFCWNTWQKELPWTRVSCDVLLVICYAFEGRTLNFIFRIGLQNRYSIYIFIYFYGYRIPIRGCCIIFRTGQKLGYY